MKFELTVTDETGAKATTELMPTNNWVKLINDLQEMYNKPDSPLYHFYKGNFDGKRHRLEAVQKELTKAMKYDILAMFNDMIDIEKGWIKKYPRKWRNVELSEHNKME
jgi:hypothetical protein